MIVCRRLYKQINYAITGISVTSIRQHIRSHSDRVIENTLTFTAAHVDVDWTAGLLSGI